MMSPLFTFAGQRVRESRIPGTTISKFHLTEKGWADDTTWVNFANMFVEEMKARGHTKALLLVDNARLHTRPVALKIFKENNVTLFGLPANTSHMMQPCDVDIFGRLKSKLKTLRGSLTELNLAHHVETALLSMQASAEARGESLASNAFKLSGLVPCNRDVFTDRHFAQSDRLLGISADHPAVAEHPKLTPEAIAKAVAESAAPLLEKGKEDIKFLAAHDAKSQRYDFTRQLYTNESAVAAMADELRAKQAVEDGVRERAAARAEKKKEADAAKAAKAVAKAAAAAEKAAAAAAAAAAPLAGVKRGRSASAGAAKSRGRASSAAGASAAPADAYARPYNPRTRGSLSPPPEQARVKRSRKA